VQCSWKKAILISENAAFLEKGQLLFKQTLFHFKYAVSKGKKYIPTLEATCPFKEAVLFQDDTILLFKRMRVHSNA